MLTEKYTKEDLAVALCFAAASRLELAFDASCSEAVRAQLLAAAADLMDKTVPSNAVRSKLRNTQPSDALAALIEMRQEIAAIPPGLWPKPRVKVSDLPASHVMALRTLDKVLCNKVTEPQKAKERLLAWLAPVEARHPKLYQEITEQLFFGE
jgi:hypothetical protein